VFTLFVNGEMVTQGSEWSLPVRENLAKRLVEGKNVIAVRGKNEGANAAFIGVIDIENADGSKQQIVTDKSWLVAADGPMGWQQLKFDDSGWKKPHSFGKLGSGRGGTCPGRGPAGGDSGDDGREHQGDCRLQGGAAVFGSQGRAGELGEHDAGPQGG
jgi:hypothetical protein